MILNATGKPAEALAKPSAGAAPESHPPFYSFFILGDLTTPFDGAV